MQETKQSPSCLLRIKQWLTSTYGPMYDAWWYETQVNSAVIWAGRYIENKLNERKDGKPVHTLDELLDDAPVSEADRWRKMFGIGKH